MAWPLQPNLWLVSGKICLFVESARSGEDCLKLNALKTQNSVFQLQWSHTRWSCTLATGGRRRPTQTFTSQYSDLMVILERGTCNTRATTMPNSNETRFLLFFFSFKIVIVLIYFFCIVCDFLVWRLLCRRSFIGQSPTRFDWPRRKRSWCRHFHWKGKVCFDYAML